MPVTAPGDASERKPPEPRVGAVWQRYARVVVWARWPVVVAWLLIGGAAITLLPTVGRSGSGGFGSLLPENSAAMRAEQRSSQEFSVPLLVDTLVVARNPAGLSLATDRELLTRAAQIDAKAAGLDSAHLPTDRPIAALPVPNTLPLPGSGLHRLTTVLTYLYFSPSLSLARQTALAKRFAAAVPHAHGTTVAVTGTVPASVAQADKARSSLIIVEIAAVLFVFAVVAVTFRSLVTPLVTLAGALLSYLITMHVLGLVGQHASLTLPPPLEPLIVSLVLGVLTDYSVFYYTEMRLRLREGASPAEATRRSLQENTPIVGVAGLTVVAGTIALYISPVHVYRVFGPGLAISVAVGVAVAMSFVPALMAILGRSLFWPGRVAPQQAQADPGGGGDAPAAAPRASWFVRAITTRPGAAVAATLSIGGLLIAAAPLTHAQLDISFIRGLPSSAPERQGAAAAEAAFPAGVLAPTIVLVEGADVTARRAELARVQHELGGLPGVAGVIGPASDPLPVPLGVLQARDHRAARYLVLLDADPLGGPAISAVNNLQDRGPALLSHAGLPHAHLAVAGQTAIAAAAAKETASNLRLVLIVAFAAEFVILAGYLRSLVAPVLLLGASGLVVIAALGLTTLVFQDHLSSEGLTFYAPFATAVLLVALGSDYNVFGVGRIWEQARMERLRPAMRHALPRSTRAILTAGLVLAGSFATVALIPLLAFREMAFAMVVGLVIDTLLVRSVLTPCLLTLVGPASGWPGRRLRQRQREPSARTPAAADRR